MSPASPCLPLPVPHLSLTCLSVPACPLTCLSLSLPVPSDLPISPSHTLSHRLPQVQERPKVLQAELALTLKVLENVAEPALRTLLDQPLHTLRHIRSQLRACVSPGSPFIPGSRGSAHPGVPCMEP